MLLLFIGLLSLTYAQKPEDASVTASKFEAYNRSGLTWIYLETSGRKMSSDVTRALEYDNMVITDRFDDNRIQDYKILGMTHRSIILQSPSGATEKLRINEELKGAELVDIDILNGKAIFQVNQNGVNRQIVLLK